MSEDAERLDRRARAAAFVRTMTDERHSEDERATVARRILTEELAASGGNISPILRAMTELVLAVHEECPPELHAFLDDRIAAPLLAGLHE